MGRRSVKAARRVLMSLLLVLGAAAAPTLGEPASAAPPPQIQKPPIPEPSPTPPEPVPGTLLPEGNCDEVRPNLKAQARDGKDESRDGKGAALCVEPDAPDKVDGPTPNAILPAPSWCGLGQWRADRTGACGVASGVVNVIGSQRTCSARRSTTWSRTRTPRKALPRGHISSHYRPRALGAWAL